MLIIMLIKVQNAFKIAYKIRSCSIESFKKSPVLIL